MIDRKAKISDFWINVKQRKKYQFLLQSIQFPEGDFTEEINIEINSGLTSLCGKNGAGKTSLLHSIYSTLTRKNLPFSCREISSTIQILNKTNQEVFWSSPTGHFPKGVFIFNG
jgi:ABC-type multidrug transport system ATPase subunit